MHTRMRFLVLLFIVAAIFAAASRAAVRERPAFDAQTFFRFEHDIDVFTREYFGCPPTGYPPEIECIQGRSEFDAKQWNKIVDEGTKLFRVR